MIESTLSKVIQVSKESTKPKFKKCSKTTRPAQT